MGDPLSLTASIIAVHGLSTKVITYLREVNHASRSRKDFLDKVNVTKGTLSLIKDYLEDASENDVITEHITLLQTGVDKYLILLKKLEEDLSAASRLRKIGNAFKWPFEKAEALETLNNLENFRTLFGAIQDEEQHARAKKKEFRRVIDWLSPLNFRARQHEVSSKQQANTGQWLLNDPKFVAWKNAEGNRRLLWCYGVPGAGKTVLASSVIKHLASTFKATNIAVLGIYCDYREHKEQSCIKYFASLLGQLLHHQNTVPKRVKDAFEQHSHAQVDPTAAEYLHMITAQLSSLKRVFVVVDALDECTEDNATRHDLIEGIMELPDKVSVMITSRHISGIEDYENALQLTIEAHEEDVRLYVQGRLKKEKKFARQVDMDDDLQTQIVDGVVEKASGM